MVGETTREQSLFQAALTVEAGESRDAFLTEACQGDAALRKRIARLLAAHMRSEGFFLGSASQMAKVEGFEVGELLAIRAADANEMLGSVVGRYKLLKQLGEGGCGIVYLAQQQEPVQRLVALKILRLGMDTKNVIARFDAERQALAMMDHPNIAKVLDAGATASGRPYFVMELVQGVKITNYCDDNHLGPRQRLNLFVQVCHAIQHAHQKGVIHRDIKPSNILVTQHDGVPAPKVIDFGIAKAISGRLVENPAFTIQGQFVGTPAYMSPEQADMSGLDVDTRSDIYSLGVLLYELLTGRPPFDQQELVRSGLDVMRQTLRERNPLRPSLLLTSMNTNDLTLMARLRHEEPPKLISSLRGDLDWIVMKALEKDRQRRYETANALAFDVRRYLNNEPVLARPPSSWYRLKKQFQRNKVVYVSGTAVVLSLMVGLGVSTWLLVKEREANLEQMRLRRHADDAQHEAELARSSESQLRQEAEAREKVTQAALLLSRGEIDKADAILGPVPLEFFTPSTEATTVFRELGQWNTQQRRWRQAADRYLVLVRVNRVDKEDLTDQASFDLMTAAPLLIESDDVEGYERIRRLALSRLEGTANLAAAEHLLKTSLLLPADEDMMKALEPFARSVSNSVVNYNPKTEGKSYIAPWRMLAMALWEYRRGNDAVCVEWLEKSSRCPDQSTSCEAGVHIFRSMAARRLGQLELANSELKLGKEMVDDYFGKKLEPGTTKSGRLAGWIMNPIFLREAEGLSKYEQN